MSSTSRRYRRTACTGLALALPLAALAACGGGSGTNASAEAGSGKGTISVWAHQGQKSEGAALQNAVKSFNSSQSKIKVDLKLIPEGDYTKTITATDASKLPDVMEFDGPTMASFVYNKKLAPIDDYVSSKTMANATDEYTVIGVPSNGPSGTSANSWSYMTSPNPPLRELGATDRQTSPHTRDSALLALRPKPLVLKLSSLPTRRPTGTKMRAPDTGPQVWSPSDGTRTADRADAVFAGQHGG
jgi:hypothetical protein